MLNKAFSDLRSGALMWNSWLHQAHHDLTSKYKRTVFGSLWVTGQMVFTSIAVSIVFSGLFGQSLQEALPYIMGGNLAAGLAFFMLSEAPDIYISAGGIIKNHAYPYTYYMYQAVARNFILFIHNIIIYYIFMAAINSIVIPHWTLLLGLPVILLVTWLWGTISAMMSARFRDLRFLLPYLAQVLFFMTPIYWRAEHLSGWRSYIAYSNPFYSLVELIRAPLLGKPATVENWAISGIVVAVGAILWLVSFGIYRRRIPFWV